MYAEIVLLTVTLLCCLALLAMAHYRNLQIEEALDTIDARLDDLEVHVALSKTTHPNLRLLPGGKPDEATPGTEEFDELLVDYQVKAAQPASNFAFSQAEIDQYQ